MTTEESQLLLAEDGARHVDVVVIVAAEIALGVATQDTSVDGFVEPGLKERIHAIQVK